MRVGWITRERCVGAIAITLGGAIAASAIAGVTVPDNQYEGRAEGDSTTYVGFDVVRKNGKRKIKAVTAHLNYRCQGGGGEYLTARLRGKIRVDDNGAFDGTVRDQVPSGARGGLEGELTYRFNGKLKRRGKARGGIDANIVIGPAPRWFDPGTRCYTGGLDWRARRGEEVEPILVP